MTNFKIKELKKTQTRKPPDAEELIQQYSNSDCALALGCKNLQQLCLNSTPWKHVHSASFTAGITKSEFYPHCVAASKFFFGSIRKRSHSPFIKNNDLYGHYSNVCSHRGILLVIYFLSENI